MNGTRATVTNSQVGVTGPANIGTLTAEQEHIVAPLGEREILALAKQIRRQRAERRRAERIAKIAAISTANSPLPHDRKYPVILADPPYRFEPFSRETGLDRSADAHYPTMTI